MATTHLHLPLLLVACATTAACTGTGDDTADTGAAVGKPDYPSWVTDVGTVADATLDGTAPASGIGGHLIAGGDLTGDGERDLLVFAGGEGGDSSAAYGVPLRPEDIDLNTAPVVFPWVESHPTLIGPFVAGEPDDIAFVDNGCSNSNDQLPKCRAFLLQSGPFSGTMEDMESAAGGGVGPTTGPQSPDEHSGRARVPDRNGDGLDEILVGDRQNGRIDLFLSPHTDDSSAIASWTLELGTGAIGFDAAVPGDCNGDGVDDFVVAHQPAAVGPYLVTVLDGSSAGTLTPEDGAITTIPDMLGRLDAVGDIDGDGERCDLITVHADDETEAVYLFDGSLGVSLATGDALAAITWEGERADLGDRVEAIGDFNGDGHDDVAVVASRIASGTVAIFLGPLSGSYSLEEADLALGAEFSGTSFARSVVALGDIDEDGRDDLAIGAPGVLEAPTDSRPVGRVYFVLGRDLP